MLILFRLCNFLTGSAEGAESRGAALGVQLRLDVLQRRVGVADAVDVELRRAAHHADDVCAAAVIIINPPALELDGFHMVEFDVVYLGAAAAGCLTYLHGFVEDVQIPRLATQAARPLGVPAAGEVAAAQLHDARAAVVDFCRCHGSRGGGVVRL